MFPKHLLLVSSFLSDGETSVNETPKTSCPHGASTAAEGVRQISNTEAKHLDYQVVIKVVKKNQTGRGSAGGCGEMSTITWWGGVR